jgi:DNA-binding transcriptional LysR family regulator
MNVRDIDIYRAVMTTGGAGRAAEVLGTSQPTVSRAIAGLEEGVGFPLFQRIRGRLVPTREGQLFFAEVTKSLAGLDRLRQAAARIREVGEGSLRIASLAAMGQNLVPRAVARFLETHPQVRVSLQVRTSSVVRDLVASGQVDIGLAADEIDATGVHTTVFASPRAVCALPPTHRLAHRKKITVADLDGQRLVALSPDDTVRRAIDRVVAEAGVAPQIIVETPFSSTVAALVAEGVGIGLMNPFAIDSDIRARIAIRPFEPAVYFRALLLRPPGAVESRLVSAFRSALYAVRNKFGAPDLAGRRR